MRKVRRMTALLQAELRALSSLVPLMVLSLLIVLVLPGGSVTLAYPLFQSPQSPVTTPTTPPPPTATATPTEVSAVPPTETPVVATVPPAETPIVPTVPPAEGETPAAAVIETPPISPISPTITIEIETPAIEPEFTPTEGRPPSESAATLAADQQPPRSSGSPGAIFIDTCVLGLSYSWLCCGGIVLVVFVLGVLASFLLRRA